MNEIRCTVCGKKRGGIFETTKQKNLWAVEIPVQNPQFDDPKHVNLCPKHKKEVREMIISDRIGSEDMVEMTKRLLENGAAKAASN
jgi:hypothetical protein